MKYSLILYSEIQQGKISRISHPVIFIGKDNSYFWFIYKLKYNKDTYMSLHYSKGCLKCRKVECAAKYVRNKESSFLKGRFEKYVGEVIGAPFPFLGHI